MEITCTEEEDGFITMDWVPGIIVEREGRVCHQLHKEDAHKLYEQLARLFNEEPYHIPYEPYFNTTQEE